MSQERPKEGLRGSSFGIAAGFALFLVIVGSVLIMMTNPTQDFLYTIVGGIVAFVGVAIGLISARAQRITPSASTDRICCCYCGRENRSDAVFCDRCGRKIT